MRHLPAIALAALLASAGASAQTQPQPQTQAVDIRKGDPTRWHQADPTRQARLQTLRKEIGAAYAEARNACRGSAATERGACLKEARTTYEQDMKNAPAQLDAAPEGSVQTTVQTTAAAPSQTSR